MEQEDYKNEEINWSYIEFVDNQDVLDLIEKKPFGIISLLDEQCLFPKSTYKTFATKLFQNLLSPRLEKTRISETDFTISHYAGKVTYQTESFLEKNRDYVVAEHVSLLSSSKCTFVSGLVPEEPEESPRSSYKFSSVASRFKQQLQALMETLNSTEPHYIRCVKPNSLNRSQLFENQSVMQQLRCGGVLEAVHISLAGYPTRRSYAEFVDRFGVLATELQDGSYDEKSITKRILVKFNIENFQLGRTKVFLRAGQIAILDAHLTEVLYRAAKFVQGHFKTFAARNDFLKKKGASIFLQSCCRGFLARKSYRSRKENVAAIVLQKYLRRWLLCQDYLKVYYATLNIQSCIRAYQVRTMTLCVKELKAAQVIQASWRRWKKAVYLKQYDNAAITIQCAWRQKLARRKLRELRTAAREAGALREAKSKLEKQLEDLMLKLTIEKRLRVSSEESKVAEISKLQSEMESIIAERDAAKQFIARENNKTKSLQREVEDLQNQIATLRTIQKGEAEMEKENLRLKNLVADLSTTKSDLENELLKYQKVNEELQEKERVSEEKQSQLQKNIDRLEEELSNLENEIRVMRQEAFQSSLFKRQMTKSTNYKYYGDASQIMKNEKNTLYEYHEIILLCAKENLGFQDGKPVAACIIYRCLLHWRAFQSERVDMFDDVIQSINDALKVNSGNENQPYWLSNASLLLCLLQRNLTTHARHTKDKMLPTTPKRDKRQEGSRAQVEARHPAILFKQQLTAVVENLFGQIRDNLKTELAPLLAACIQAPRLSRQHGKTSRAPAGTAQVAPSTHWESIIDFLDSFMRRLNENFVPSFFIGKLATQLFSFINIQLFNSLLLRRECCTYSNGEYVNSGLLLLEKWIAGLEEALSGNAWHELISIRQAVKFLLIHHKRNITLKEIRNEICPSLTISQLNRICSVYWDDKYGTQAVPNEIVEALSEMNSHAHDRSFLLDEDQNIPFSVEDLSKAIPVINPMDVELPASLANYEALQFLKSP